MTGTAIDVEDESTWPQDLRRTLERGFEVLRAHESESVRLQAAHDDKRLNVHNAARLAIIADVDSILRPLWVRAFHCTNLHAEELATIRHRGLLPLTIEDREKRITARVRAGEMPEDVGDLLISMCRKMLSDPDHSHRVGEIWFFFSRTALEREDELFRYWGGEAVRFLHDEDEQIFIFHDCTRLSATRPSSPSKRALLELVVRSRRKILRK